MIFRFNFGTEDSPVPEGYTLDFGEGYSASKGFGWVTDTDRVTPLDLTPNGRDRDLIEDQLRDTLIHMQYPEDNPNQDSIRTSAAWLYDLEDGVYRVTIGVGDPGFIDSSYRLDVEDNNFINEFVPDSENLFATVTRIIEVSDGQLTVDALDEGINTKINFIEIASVTDTTINFGASNSTPPGDFIIDTGAGYSNSLGYGWVTQRSISSGGNGTPLDVTPNARERDLLENDFRDSLIHMQYPEDADNPTAVRTPAGWEYAIPNGDYRITATVGDAAFTDSVHSLNMEGVEFIDGFTPDNDNFFNTTTKVVSVTDGRLTVDAIGGENTKINSIRIDPITEVRINFGPDNITAIPDDYYQDFGQFYSEDRGYGWITQDSVGSEDTIPLDITGNTRTRGFADDAISDSLIHMQYPEELDNPTANTTPAAWEYAIPNGEYQVRVGVGDTSFTDSIHQINIEGVTAISGFEPSSGELFTTATAIVEVDDGRLTIDAIGGENTKLNFVEIAIAES